MKKYTFQILILAALVLTACGGNNEAAENLLTSQMNLLATTVPGSAITQAGSYMIAAFPQKIQSPDKSYISVVLAYTTTTLNAPEVPPLLAKDAQVPPELMFDNGTSSIPTSSTFLPCLPAKDSNTVFVYANQKGGNCTGLNGAIKIAVLTFPAYGATPTALQMNGWAYSLPLQ